MRKYNNRVGTARRYVLRYSKTLINNKYNGRNFLSTEFYILRNRTPAFSVSYALVLNIGFGPLRWELGLRPNSSTTWIQALSVIGNFVK